MSQRQRMLEEWARRKSEKSQRRAEHFGAAYDNIKRGQSSQGARPGVGARPKKVAPEKATKGTPEYWGSFWGKVENLRSKAAKQKVEKNSKKDSGTEASHSRARRANKRASRRMSMPATMPSPHIDPRMPGTSKLDGRTEAKEKTATIERTNLDLHSNNGNWMRGDEQTRNENLEKLFGKQLRRDIEAEKAKEKRMNFDKQAAEMTSKMEYYRELARKEIERRKQAHDEAGAKHDTSMSKKSPLKNSERFFQEQKARLDRMKQRKEKRFNPPKHMEEAKEIVKEFQKDVKDKWSKYENSNPARDYAGARAKPSTSSYSGGAGSSMPEKYAKMSIKELMTRLKKFRVSTAGVREKADLVKKLIPIEEAEEAKKAEERKKRQKDELKARIIKEVQRWSKGKGIKEILNSLGNKQRGDSRYLNRLSGFTEVSKVYKRVLVKIHPDKNMHSFEALTRATEQFKIVNAMYSSYKARHER